MTEAEQELCLKRACVKLGLQLAAKSDQEKAKMTLKIM